MKSSFSFSFIDKKYIDDILPELYDILYNNMSIIVPTGNSYEDDKNQWSPCIISALEKPQRNIILIYEENRIIGFFMYYTVDETLMMEEIQFKAEFHGTGVFNELYRYLFNILSNNIEFVEAYANKKNQKSQDILSHLGLEIIGENKNGSSFHYRGEYQILKNIILKEF